MFVPIFAFAFCVYTVEYSSSFPSPPTLTVGSTLYPRSARNNTTQLQTWGARFSNFFTEVCNVVAKSDIASDTACLIKDHYRNRGYFGDFRKGEQNSRANLDLPKMIILKKRASTY